MPQARWHRPIECYPEGWRYAAVCDLPARRARSPCAHAATLKILVILVDMARMTRGTEKESAMDGNPARTPTPEWSGLRPRQAALVATGWTLILLLFGLPT